MAQSCNRDIEFEIALTQFKAIRMDWINEHILSTIAEYQTLMKDCTQLFSDISDHLSIELQVRFNEYEEKITLIQGLSESIMYTEGLKDGKKLSSLFT